MFDAGGNLYFDGVGQKFEAAAFAGGAGRFDEQAASIAARAAGQGHHPHGLVGAHLLLLAAAVTFGAAHRLGSGFGAAAAASLANIRARKLDDALAAFGGVIQGELQIVAQIGALGSYCRARRAAGKHVAEHAPDIAHPAAEKIAEVEVAENIFGAPALAHTGVAGGIVGVPLGLVGQDRIGFGDFLESVRGIGRGIAIRMPLHRQLTVGLFDLFLTGGSVQAENFVVVAFLLGRHDSNFCCQLAKFLPAHLVRTAVGSAARPR